MGNREIFDRALKEWALLQRIAGQFTPEEIDKIKEEITRDKDKIIKENRWDFGVLKRYSEQGGLNTKEAFLRVIDGERFKRGYKTASEIQEEEEYMERVFKAYQKGERTLDYHIARFEVPFGMRQVKAELARYAERNVGIPPYLLLRNGIYSLVVVATTMGSDESTIGWKSLMFHPRVSDTEAQVMIETRQFGKREVNLVLNSLEGKIISPVWSFGAEVDADKLIFGPYVARLEYKS